MEKARRFTILAATALGGIACATAASAGDQEWRLVRDQSSVTFSALQQGSRFTGLFQDFSAEVMFDPEHPAQGKIVGVVRTASVNTRDTDRDSTLPDRDWFDSSQYPEARFESESISKAPNGEGYVANGQLTLKGKTKPAKLDFTFDEADPSTATLHGTMTIDRFDYNVGEGYNDTSWVSQDVDVEVDLKLTT